MPNDCESKNNQYLLESGGTPHRARFSHWQARQLAAIALIVVAGLAAPGCTSRSRYCPPNELTRTSGLIQLSPDDATGATESELVRAATQRSHSAFEPAATPPRKMQALVLSGGGMYGAYVVGVLSGWTTMGTRPEFDIVTGISTGGLIANYAFLGTAYDRQMIEAYTNVSSRDIYRRRLAATILINDAVASSEPLKRMIDNQVDDAFLASVAQAHLAGRRLYVGTTNIDTRRLVVWDMGAIAASGRPDARELYRKILLASASPPGFLPPVPIEVDVNGKKYTELHVDGGATTGLFLQASSLNIDRDAVKADRRPLAGSNTYVIVAGKLYADPSCTDRRVVRIGESALRSLIYSQTRSEISKIYALCQVTGMNFHLASIPEDLPVSGDSMSFNRDEMKRLLEEGSAASTGGRAWRSTPPGGEPYERNEPRSGNQFLAPAANGNGG